MRFHSSQEDGTYMHATYLISIYKEPKSICHNMLIDLRLLAMTIAFSYIPDFDITHRWFFLC